MARKSDEEIATFRAKTVPERSRELEEQVVVPAVWDVLSDLINTAEEDGNEELRLWAQTMMEESFFGKGDGHKAPLYPSKMKFMIAFFEKTFKQRIITRRKDGLDKDHLDLTQEAVLKMLTEDTTKVVITDVDQEIEILEKLRLVAVSVFRDAFKSAEYNACGEAKRELRSDGYEQGENRNVQSETKRVPFLTGSGYQKQVDQFLVQRKKDLEAFKKNEKAKHGEAKRFVPADKRPTEIIDEKAERFIQQRNKENERKAKKS